MTDKTAPPPPKERVERLLCHMLRHEPKRYRVSVSSQGWANAEQVLSAIAVRSKWLCLWQTWTKTELARFCALHADRFELRGNRIRARYGHSLPVTVGKVAAPPPLLFHGTTDVYMNSIRMLGLRAYRRTFVHLTTNTNYAAEVADSAEGQSLVLLVRAGDAATQGTIEFRQATEHVWLCKSLPVEFVELSAGAAPLLQPQALNGVSQ